MTVLAIIFEVVGGIAKVSIALFVLANLASISRSLEDIATDLSKGRK